MIDIAIIPAAGRGTRLGELGAGTPKAMIDVAGRPAIVRVLDGLAAAGLTQAVVVTGHGEDQVRAGVANAPIEIRFVRQERLDGTATAVLAARPEVGDRPFLVAWCDVMVDHTVYRDVREASRGSVAAIAVNRVDDPSAGAAVWVSGGRVTRIVEKPRDAVDTEWNNAGIAAFPSSAWPLIEAIEPSERGEYELPDAIGRLVDMGAVVRAVPIAGPCIDIGTPEGLDRARDHFGGSNDPGSGAGPG